MYSHAIIQLICLQKLFRLQHSENMSMVSECDICVTCDKKSMSTSLRGDYGSVSFFLVMVFVPISFSVTRFLTRHYVIHIRWMIKGECYKIKVEKSMIIHQVLSLYGHKYLSIL